MALTYLLPCKCGHRITVAESLAGTYVTCMCGRSVPVPARNKLFALQLAPAKVPEPIPEKIPAPLPAQASDAAADLPLTAEVVSDACPACGAVLPSGARYCWLCGAKYAASALEKPPLRPNKPPPPPASDQHVVLWLIVIVAAVVGFGVLQGQDLTLTALFLIAVVPALIVVVVGSLSARQRGEPWTPGKTATVVASTAATTLVTALVTVVVAAAIAAVMLVASIIAFFAMCAALLGGGS